MKLLINDANILIDIVKLDVIEAFLSLNFELYTTDFVFAELEDHQKKNLVSERLKVITTESEADFSEIIILLNTHNGLSFEDCSVWYYAKKLNGTLVTGDGALRKKVIQSGIEVRGIIYIIEQIKLQNQLPIRECIEILHHLKKLNIRLPHNEIDKRIQNWENEIIYSL